MNIKDSDGNYITLSSFNDVISSEKARLAKMYGLSSIYKLLKTNDKELVKMVIDSLSEEEKSLFARRNGNDLDNPILSHDWTKEDSKNYKGKLIPKMRNYVSQLKYNGFIIKKQSSSKKTSITHENLVMEKPVEFDVTERIKTIEEAVEKDNMNAIDESFKNDDGFKIVKDYILSEPDFTDKQALVMYLGFNGKFYSQKEIAERFGYSASNISYMISKLSKKIDEKLRKNNIKDKEGNYMTVSAFRQFLNNKKHEEVYKKRKLLIIYEQLNLSDKCLIEKIMNSLSKEEKRLFERRNGSDLDNPILSDDWTKEDSKKYNNLITKMKKILMKIQSTIVNEKQEEPTKEKEVNLKEDTTKEVVSRAVIDLPKEETTEIDLEITTSTDKYIEERGTYWPNLDIILERMPHYEAFIVSLKLGLSPNERIYTTDEIANFLNIDRGKIIEIVKNTLLLYKKNFNNFIDELINEEKINTK